MPLARREFPSTAGLTGFRAENVHNGAPLTLPSTIA